MSGAVLPGRGFESRENRMRFRPDDIPGGSPLARILSAVRSLTPRGVIAVGLEPSCGRGARALVHPRSQAVVDFRGAFCARLMTWLAGTRDVRVLPVPHALSPWLPFERGAVIPIATPVWRAGVVVIPSETMSLTRLEALRALAADMALRLEQSDRRSAMGALELRDDPLHEYLRAIGNQ